MCTVVTVHCRGHDIKGNNIEKFVNEVLRNPAAVGQIFHVTCYWFYF